VATRQIILFVLIVCLPLALLAWLGSRLARNEQEMVQQRFRQLLTERLEDTDGLIAEYFQGQERELLELTDLENVDPDHIRRIVRRHPGVNQLFVLDADGLLIHPDPAQSLNDSERRFLQQAEQVFLDKELVRGPVAEDEETAPSTHGWYVRYWGPGLQLIFHRRLESGQVVGVLLERSRWIADLIAQLPQTAPRDRSSSGLASRSRIRMEDSNKNTVYQWGLLEPDDAAQPVVELRVAEPLGSWRLTYFADAQQFAAVGRSAYFSLYSALALVGIGLIVASVYFYREYARQMRDSLQRVNFVNQVSHELKTPLTSIRMYAELLQNDFELLQPEEVARARGHLGVIVAESQRLSRLIGNVLTFARQKQNKLTSRKTTARVDEVIGRVLQQFEPVFRRSEIEVTFDGSAASPVRLDVDAVEQILGNLFGNVEKYAAAGHRMEIVSRQEDDYTTIEVADRGPGIPASFEENVFRPFYRISDRIDRGTGTGIGLSIARQLARLHGGDVTLLRSDVGARFQVRLHTPAER
jgi:signal transduction histidine kinase